MLNKRNWRFKVLEHSHHSEMGPPVQHLIPDILTVSVWSGPCHQHYKCDWAGGAVLRSWGGGAVFVRGCRTNRDNTL